MTRVLSAATLLLGLATGPANAAEAPTVVELFTSQGCSSCPPADAVLAQLAEREDVIALAFHVDYWDRLGWPDPFATAWGTARQTAYRDAFGLPYVYTPQLVVDGAAETVGSRRLEVVRLVARGADRIDRFAVRLERWPGDRVRVAVPAGQGWARVLLFGYDPRNDTEVRSGENAGRRLRDANAVRSMADLGRWDGRALELDAALPDPQPGRAYAVVVQEVREGGGPGRVLGAGKLKP